MVDYIRLHVEVEYRVLQGGIDTPRSMALQGWVIGKCLDGHV